MQVPFISLGSEQLSSALLQEVDVVQRLNDHWTCRIVLRDTPDRRPPVEDYAGKELKITTTELDGSEAVVFHGLVRGMRLIYEVTGAWGAELDAVSATWTMAQGTRLKYFRQQSAQATANTVVSNAGLQMGGAMPGGATLSYVQWDETDYHFFARLVDDAEAWFRPAVDGSGGLDVETAFQTGTTVNWREGEYGLLEWTTQGLLQPVTASGANYDPQKMTSTVVTGTGSSVGWYGGAADKMVAAAQAASASVEPAWVDRHRAATLDDLTQRMQREARRGIANTVRCTGISRNPRVRAGDTLAVTGLPGVDATYGVIEVRHAWTTQGYENHFTVTPAQRWSPAVRPARPQLDGVYPARVVDNYDPHNQGRIRVQYYWQEENQSTWVRLLTPHAGAGRGTLFLPEVGDEVLVTFEEGDAERPYVVGSAWNGVHQPPATGFHSPGETNGSEFEKNYIKRIVTKSGHRITLVDTPGKETISIATPTSNRLMLTESHADTGNRPAIVLESAGDIIMAAPNGRIHTQSMHRSAEVGVSGSPALADGAGGNAGAVLTQAAFAVPAHAPSASSATKAAAPAPAKPFDCKGTWSSTVAQVNKTDNIADPLKRNQQITADYANLYKQTPDLQWAGLASVVSRNAGCGMVKSGGIADMDDVSAQVQQHTPNPDGGMPMVSPITSIQGGSARTAFNGLADTNQTIYRTVAPTMSFVSQHGAKQLQSCMGSGAIPVRDNLSDKTANAKLDNSAVPPQLQGAVGKLAAAEDMPAGSPQRAATDLQASNMIAAYEQQGVVQQRIYNNNSELQSVMSQNQSASKWWLGRLMGATPPTVAFSADCGASDRVPFAGSINDPKARVDYYGVLMQQFGSANPAARSSLINQLSGKPGF